MKSVILIEIFELHGFAVNQYQAFMNSTQCNLVIFCRHAEYFIFAHEVFGTGNEWFHCASVTVKQSIIGGYHKYATFIRYNATNAF